MVMLKRCLRSFKNHLQGASCASASSWWSMSRFKLACQTFHSNQSGVVALIFAIASVPLLIITAFAVDYTQTQKNITTLQAAADSAALAAVSPGVYSSYTSRARQNSQSADTGLNTFNSMVPDGVTVTGSSMKTTPTKTGMRADFTYTATMPPSLFSSLFPANMISGKASAESGAQVTDDIDVYILIDISQSMAAGVDAATQQKMKNDPEMSNCQFACHFGNEKGTSNVDTIAVAARKGYQLRIDAIKQSLIANIQAATQADPNKKLRFMIGTMANEAQVVVPWTSDFQLLQAGINSITIPKYRSGSNINYSLAAFGQSFANSVDWKRKNYQIIITDGVQNAITIDPVGSAWQFKSQVTSGDSWVNMPCWDLSQDASPDVLPPTGGGYAIPSGSPMSTLGWGSVYRFCIPDRTVYSYIMSWDYYPIITGVKHAGFPSMSIGPMDPYWCMPPYQALEMTFMTLYTEYPAPPIYSKTDLRDWNRNEWRFIYMNDYVVPKLESSVADCSKTLAPRVKHKAPDNAAFKANDAAGIAGRLNDMFSRFVPVSTARLVQ